MRQMHKSFYIILIVAYVILNYTGCSQKMPYSRGLFWQVNASGVEPSYVLGTMHSEDPRILTLDKKVEDLFLKSQAFIMEVKIDQHVIDTMQAYLHLPQNTSLDAILDSDLYKNTVKILVEYGMSEHEIKRLKPWAVFMILSTPKPKTGLVLDLTLMIKAQQSGKEIAGLESIEEQLSIFDELSLDKQIGLLKMAINQNQNFTDELEKLTNLYLQGDLQGLSKLSEHYFLDDDKAFFNELMNRLVYNRNRLMADRLRDHLRIGNKFIAVGALHLPGNQGLLKRLHDHGFELKRVDLTD